MKHEKRIKFFLGAWFYSVGPGSRLPKPHGVAFGKWTSVKWQAGDDEGKPVDVKIRPLYLDGRTKEFRLGPTHEVTERAFVVQRIFRWNDSLPRDAGPAWWRWERGRVAAS